MVLLNVTALFRESVVTQTYIAWALQVFELMRKQEDTRQAEENTRKAEYQALQAQHETVCFSSAFEDCQFLKFSTMTIQDHFHP